MSPLKFPAKFFGLDISCNPLANDSFELSFTLPEEVARILIERGLDPCEEIGKAKNYKVVGKIPNKIKVKDCIKKVTIQDGKEITVSGKDLEFIGELSIKVNAIL